MKRFISCFKEWLADGDPITPDDLLFVIGILSLGVCVLCLILILIF